jgi:hypothetical protein
VSNRAGRRGFTTWWARRRAEKLRLKKQEELNNRELELKDLELAKAKDAYAEEKAARADAAKEAKTSAAREAVRARWRAFRERVANDRPLLAAFVMSGVCLIVEFVGQLMFYGALKWPPYLLFMPVLLSTIVTGATWTFAINADYLTSKGLSGAADIRKMWYWSTAAALTNGYHGVVVLKEVSVGIVLGSASLVGPYIWHRYVTLQKVAKSGRTAEQIRAALLRRLLHPLLWKRTVDLWAAADGALTQTEAWRIIWLRSKGAAPGMPSRTELTPARHRWLFRLVFGRIVNPTLRVTVTATPDAEEVAPTDRPQPRRVARVAQPGTTIWKGWLTDSNLAAAMKRMEAEFEATPSATTDGAATATPESGEDRSSDDVAQPSNRPARKPSRNSVPRPPVAQPGGVQPSSTQPEVAAGEVSQPSSAATPSTAAGWVERYFHEQVADGVNPLAVSATEASKYAASKGAECSRQNAAKVIARLRGQNS